MPDFASTGKGMDEVLRASFQRLEMLTVSSCVMPTLYALCCRDDIQEEFILSSTVNLSVELGRKQEENREWKIKVNLAKEMMTSCARFLWSASKRVNLSLSAGN